jgi:hypothetical protein
MDKRDRFIAELRDEAQRRGLSFRLETRRGKGGHGMDWQSGHHPSFLGNRPEDGQEIRKSLGLD